MTEVDSRYVKRGLWVDLDQGPVMGKTITTDTKSGTIVVAIVALMASIGESGRY